MNSRHQRHRIELETASERVRRAYSQSSLQARADEANRLELLCNTWMQRCHEVADRLDQHAKDIRIDQVEWMQLGVCLEGLAFAAIRDPSRNMSPSSDDFLRNSSSLSQRVSSVLAQDHLSSLQRLSEVIV